MSERLNTELPSTLLFDHPSLRSIADSLSVYDEAEEVLEPKFETAQEPRYLMQRPQRAKAQSTTAVVETISSTLSDILGTRVATDAPLMSVGLDSIAATELTNALAERFDTELPQTLMFDHPTIDAMASFIAETTEMSVAAVTVEREAMPTTTMAMAVMTSRQDAPDRVFLASRQIRCTIPGGCHDPPALKELGLRAWTANSHWPVSRLAAVELQGTSAAYGAFLAPDAFKADPVFFGISRTEARAMDPMAMLVLATTYGALSDSSSNARAKLANAPIGFFLGAGGIISGTGGGTASPPGAKRAPSVYSATSGALSVLSGRLSYTLGLTGPCQTTDTACSSSLVAAHQAVSALKLGESPAAAVAGVMVLTVPVSVAFSAAGMLSALGRCHTFDRRADGYCRGEGCGAFYFSTEADDVAVSGTAVQQDGPSASLTAPNGSSQQRLIEAVEAGNGPSLEAHGTGTALGDPIEVGAATRALCKGRERGSAAIQCTSLKSNMGHLEPAAAAAGLASLVVGPLMASVVAVNAQLRGLNAHLSSIVSSKPFQMPVDVAPRTTALSGSRLSSFGFSGTIAHGAFEARKTIVSMSNDSKSLYRGRRFITSSETTRLDWLLEAPGPQEPRPDEAVVFSGALSPSALLLFSHHVVGGTIILPGVGYVEMAFAASSSRALTAVAFLRPCVLPEPGRGEKCVLRCTRRSGALEIASARGTDSSSFATCFAGTLAHNIIESGGHAETVIGRSFKARKEWSIKAQSSRRNSAVLQATFGPRPRLLELSSRIGGTAWTFGARKFLCSASRQLSRSTSLANAVSDYRNVLCQARQQLCKSLRGTILPRSRLLASRAQNNKWIYSCNTSGLRLAQVEASSFREMLLVTVGPSKPLSAGRVPQPTPSKLQSNLRLKEPAAAKGGARSQKALLEELTAMAAEVTGTTISADAPLMSAGLDSIGATELSNKISAHLNTELSPTLLFDHPSLRSIADALSVDHETEGVLELEFETTAQEPRDSVQRPQQSAKAQSTPAIVEAISSTLSDILGTTVATDAPLMSVGLDSISATEFTNALAEKFDTELPQTLMFDQPTIDAMAGFIAETTEAPVAAATVEREQMPTTTMATAVATSGRDAPDRVFLASRQISFTLPGGCNDPTALKELGLRAWTANSHWPVSRLAANELQGTSAAYGAFLAPDAFKADPVFFGISRTEARAMDPMAMLVLATTYGALSDSSSNSRAKLANAPIGFFLGAGGSTFSKGLETASGNATKAPSVYSATSGALSVLSGRLSYTLGLTGPCQTTDTACSSSLVAAHQAVSALKLGESPAAAVAGVGVLTVSVSVAFSAAGMLSALGRCHTFDRRADGYCRGEGCGAFYFSTEADDVAVSGTAVQQDGPSASLTAPNGTSQQRLIEAVKAGSGPSLEAHGTGTALGDPIEVCAYFLFL